MGLADCADQTLSPVSRHERSGSAWTAPRVTNTYVDAAVLRKMPQLLSSSTDTHAHALSLSLPLSLSLFYSSVGLLVVVAVAVAVAVACRRRTLVATVTCRTHPAEITGTQHLSAWQWIGEMCASWRSTLGHTVAMSGQAVSIFIVPVPVVLILPACIVTVTVTVAVAVTVRSRRRTEAQKDAEHLQRNVEVDRYHVCRHRTVRAGRVHFVCELQHKVGQSHPTHAAEQCHSADVNHVARLVAV